MVQNPPAGYQRVIPYLLYEDAPAAIDFLCKAFGFEERIRMPGPDGSIIHAEVGYQDNVVMLASAKLAAQHLGEGEEPPGLRGMLGCYVDDVDAHFALAKVAGATIIQELADQFYGDRTYRAVDPEGHHWSFHTHIRDVAPEDMKPPNA